MTTDVLLIANFDSGLKYADRVADALSACGARVELAAPTTVAPHSLGVDQIRAATARPLRIGTWDELVTAAAAADIVVPVFDGPNIERFIRAVHVAAENHQVPVFGAGYVGMALYDIVGGYLMRSLADVVAVNSRTDLAEFSQAASALELPSSSLLLTGLALLRSAPAPLATGPIRTVLFADQPTVPKRGHERMYIWDRLLAYAERHPDRQVILRPRHRPDENTFHRMRYSPVTWAASRTLPPNFRIDHTPIGELIHRSDLLLTVSSTAALEALAAGVRVAFVADFLNDAALNPRLLPSGLLRRFDDIEIDAIPAPDPSWIDDLFPSAGNATPAARFATRLIAVSQNPSLRSHESAWASTFHTGRRSTDAALADLRRPIQARRRYTPRRLAAGALRRALRVMEP